MEVFSFAKRKCQKIHLQRVSPDSGSSSPPFFRRYFAFWHSCLSERKHPTLTSYSRNPQLPPFDFAPFCRMNRYLERFNLPHTQPFAAVRQIACRIRTYETPSSVYMLFHFCRITHNACRLRLPRIWNPSFRHVGLFNRPYRKTKISIFHRFILSSREHSPSNAVYDLRMFNHKTAGRQELYFTANV